MILAVIHHDPDRGASRGALAILRETVEPIVIEYLGTGWTRPQLLGLFAAAGLAPRDASRTAGTSAEAMGSTEASVTNDVLLDAMVAGPILVSGPIVCTPLGVRLRRPSETVRELVGPMRGAPTGDEE